MSVSFPEAYAADITKPIFGTSVVKLAIFERPFDLFFLVQTTKFSELEGVMLQKEGRGGFCQ